MDANTTYALAFVVLPGAAIAAFTWYWRFSHHRHRRKPRRGAAAAAAMATLEIGSVALVLWALVRFA